MAASELSRLLALPVRHRGITLGRVADVLLGDDGAPVGLAVRSVVDEDAFLPWPSAVVGADEVQVPYPLSLLSRAELVFYRSRSRSLVEELGARASSPEADAA
jgi:hypothetical protein